MIKSTVIILALVAACGEDPPVQLWDCTGTAQCDGSSSTTDYEVCDPRLSAEQEDEDWVGVCTDAVALVGCGSWNCKDLCRPTGIPCIIVNDAALAADRR